MQTLMPTPTPTAEQYLNSRKCDHIALTHDLQSAEKIGNTINLGYCKLIDNRKVETSKGVQEFRGLAEASAYILRVFW